MSKTFVVTGASGKMDGILYVVDAETPLEAAEKIANSMERVYDITDLGLFIVPKRYTPQDVEKEMEADGNVRYGWQIWAEELTKDMNLHNAVCW